MYLKIAESLNAGSEWEGKGHEVFCTTLNASANVIKIFIFQTKIYGA